MPNDRTLIKFAAAPEPDVGQMHRAGIDGQRPAKAIVRRLDPLAKQGHLAEAVEHDPLSPGVAQLQRDRQVLLEIAGRRLAVRLEQGDPAQRPRLIASPYLSPNRRFFSRLDRARIRACRLLPRRSRRLASESQTSASPRSSRASR